MLSVVCSYVVVADKPAAQVSWAIVQMEGRARISAVFLKDTATRSMFSLSLGHGFDLNMVELITMLR